MLGAPYDERLYTPLIHRYRAVEISKETDRHGWSIRPWALKTNYFWKVTGIRDTVTPMGVEKRFLWGTGITFVLASSHPVSILAGMGSTEGGRWIQNDPAYSFFVLLILPLAVGIFARTFDPHIVKKLPKQHRVPFLVLLGVMQLFAVLLASQEVFRGEAVSPTMLKMPMEALNRDSKLRLCLQGIRENRPSVCGEMGYENLSNETIEQASADAAVDYKAEAPAFTSLADLRRRGSWTAYVSSFFDVFSGVFVLLAFWYMIALVASKHVKDVATNNAMIVVYALLLLWFPARLYSEWYIHFYSVAHLTGYYAFLFLFFLALIAIPLLVLLLKPAQPVLVFTTVNGVFLTMVGLLSHFRPELIRVIAQALETMPFLYFAAFALLITVVVGVMVYAMVPGRTAPEP